MPLSLSKSVFKSPFVKSTIVPKPRHHVQCAGFSRIFNVFTKADTSFGSDASAIGNKNINPCRIVCFGDSITWGFDPFTTERLEQHRWPKIFAHELNTFSADSDLNLQFEVISEGLNGRTLDQEDLEFNEDNIRRNLSMHGMNQMLPILYSHRPVDLVIVMLGINDCKSRFNPTAERIGATMERMLLTLKQAEIWRNAPNSEPIASGARQLVDCGQPAALLLAPIYMRQVVDACREWGFDEVSMQVSEQLPAKYLEVTQSEQFNDWVKFVDANVLVEPGEDAIHLDAEANATLGKLVAENVKQMLLMKSMD